MRRLIGLEALVGLLCLLFGCNTVPESLTRTGMALDTTFSITLYDTSDGALMESCLRLLEEKENRLSKTRPGSDIWRINHAEGQSVTVHEETARLIEKAVAVSKWTDGAFDITIAPVSALWDFTAADPRLPDPDAVAEAVQLVDYTGIAVEGTTVRLAKDGMQLDLGGIAKGYIADCLAAFLKENGVSRALIDLGGNILTVGDHHGRPFRIGLQSPFDADALTGTVEVSDRAVVTSGSYERCFTIDNVRYHHLLDPQTGYPAVSGLVSVSILADTAVDADALSTACFLLGEQKGRQLLETLEGVEGVFVLTDQTVVTTSGVTLSA